MGKARGIGSDELDHVSTKRNKWAGYALERTQPDLIGDTQFGEQSGQSGSLQQSGINLDRTKLPLEGGQMIGNVGWTLGTARIVVATNDLNLFDDGSGNAIDVIPAMLIVSFDTGTSGTLTTITGAQRDGQRLMMFGIQGNTYTITHTAAATSDTITCPANTNVTWSDDQVVEFIYDITTAKWRLVTLPDVGSGGGGLDLTTKGDLHTYTTVDFALPIGTTGGHVLTVDAAEASGMKWAVVGAAAQTPWAQDIDAATFSLLNLDLLDFDENVDAPTAGNAQIYWDSLTGIHINVPTGDEVRIDVQGAEQANFTVSGLDMTSNDIFSVGILSFIDTDNSISQFTGLQYDVDAAETHRWRVGNVVQMSLTDADLDVEGNTVSGLTTLNWDDGDNITSTPTEFVTNSPTGTTQKYKIDSVEIMSMDLLGLFPEKTGVDLGQDTATGHFNVEYVNRIRMNATGDRQEIVGLATGITFDIGGATDSFIFNQSGTEMVRFDKANANIVMSDLFLSIINVPSGKAFSIAKQATTGGTDLSDADSINLQIALTDEMIITAASIDILGNNLLNAQIMQSNATTPADNGTIRLGNAQSIQWRQTGAFNATMAFDAFDDFVFNYNALTGDANFLIKSIDNTIVRLRSDNNAVGEGAGFFIFEGKNASAVTHEYARITAIIRDTTAALEDGSFSFNVHQAGANITYLSLRGDNQEIDMFKALAMNTNPVIEVDFLALTEKAGDPPVISNEGVLYTKDVGGDTQLFYDNNTESPINLSAGGAGGIPHSDGNGTTDIIQNTTDNTKTLRFDLTNKTTGTDTTFVIKGSTNAEVVFPNVSLATVAVANFNNSFSASQTFSGAGTGLTVTTAASFQDDVTLGNGTADLLAANGRWATDLDPSTNGTRDFGFDTLRWRILYLQEFTDIEEGFASGVAPVGTTDDAKIFCRPNGTDTELRVKFQTGNSVLLAIEPP